MNYSSKRGLLLLAVFAFILLVVGNLTFAVQVPDTITQVASSRRVHQPNKTHEAYAGNVTQIDIDTDQVTRNWQGYYGEVSGSIILDDALNYSLYEWNLVDPVGEVYASRTHSISWVSGNIVCVDESHIATEESTLNTDSEVTKPGNARDGVNETFNMTTHPEFNVSNNHFAASVCNHSTSLFVSDTNPDSGTVARSFNETLIYANSNSAFIYMAYINPNQQGFNDTNYDFQMLVGEDGHLDDTSSTTYYFYTELE